MSKTIWLLDLIVSIVLPWWIYDQLQSAGTPETIALLWSAAPPLLWSLLELVWHRRLDAISLLSLLGILLSAGLMLIGGDPRWVLVRESFVTGLIGLAALASLGLKKPALYYLARALLARSDPASATTLDKKIQKPAVIDAMKRMTLVWGSAMILECAVRIWMAFTLPLATSLLVSPFIFYAVMGMLALWTLHYRRQLQHR